MSFERPTLQTIIDRISGDFSAYLPGSDALLRRSNMGVMARSQAGAAHGLYGYLDWLSKQLMPDSADSDNLARWSDIWGINRNPATQATGNITFTGIENTAIPIGTELARSDGQKYTTLEAAIIPAIGTIDVQIQAVVAGELANSQKGVSLSISAPIPNVNSTAIVAALGIAAGFDVENDDSLRARLLSRIQAPPHGGAKHDYIAWAKEVTGVSDVYVFPRWYGTGTVGLTFVVGEDNVIPSTQEVAAVQAHIDTQRPVTADVSVFAPVAEYVSFRIQVDPDTSAVRAAVEQELKNLFIREARPGGTLYVSHIREAISVAAGEQNNALVSPVDDIPHNVCAMPVFGAITWL